MDLEHCVHFVVGTLSEDFSHVKYPSSKCERGNYNEPCTLKKSCHCRHLANLKYDEYKPHVFLKAREKYSIYISET